MYASVMGGMHAAQPDLHTPYSPGLCCLYRCLAVVEDGQVLKLAIRIMNHGAVSVLSHTHTDTQSCTLTKCTSMYTYSQCTCTGAHARCMWYGPDHSLEFRGFHPPPTLPPPPCCFSLFLNIPFAVLMKTVRDFYSSCLLHK